MSKDHLHRFAWFGVRPIQEHIDTARLMVAKFTGLHRLNRPGQIGAAQQDIDVRVDRQPVSLRHRRFTTHICHHGRPYIDEVFSALKVARRSVDESVESP